MDRRQKKTREAIFRAFEGLLERKDYDSITVQEIIDEADIGRSTFYAHFETKDALLRALCTDIFDHVFSPALTREATHDFSSAAPDLAMRLTHILYHLQEKRMVLRGLLPEENGGLFMKYFRQYLSEMFAGYLNGDADRDRDGDAVRDGAASRDRDGDADRDRAADKSENTLFGAASSDCPEDFLLHHAVTGFAEAVRWWLLGGGDAYSPEDIARFYLTVMHG